MQTACQQIIFKYFYLFWQFVHFSGTNWRNLCQNFHHFFLFELSGPGGVGPYTIIAKKAVASSKIFLSVEYSVFDNVSMLFLISIHAVLYKSLCCSQKSAFICKTALSRSPVRPWSLCFCQVSFLLPMFLPHCSGYLRPILVLLPVCRIFCIC